MQQDSALSRTFVQRTDQLAARLGLNVQDLPGIIGISRRTLFECRSAESAVSGKTLAKLQAAEEKANIQTSGAGKEESNGDLKGLEQLANEISSVVRDDPTPYRVNVKPRNERIRDAFADIRRGLDVLENLLLSDTK